MPEPRSSDALGDPGEPPVVDRSVVLEGLSRASITLLDAQSPGWYERERLPGALRGLPDDLDSLEDTLPDGRETEIVVYCWDASCSASERVARQLMELGYPRVRRYRAGKRDWIAAGLPVERGAP